MLSTSDARETENTCADLGLEEKLQALLQEMLVGVRHHRETTLLAGFDSLGIVVAALRGLSTCDPQTALSHLQDSETLSAVFNLVARQAVEDQPNTNIPLPSLRQSSHTLATASQQRTEQVTQHLAAWLEQFCLEMNLVHPKSIEVVILRFEGCGNRQIARRLGLTLRLVKRIVHDIHRVCQCASKG